MGQLQEEEWFCNSWLLPRFVKVYSCVSWLQQSVSDIWSILLPLSPFANKERTSFGSKHSSLLVVIYIFTYSWVVIHRWYWNFVLNVGELNTVLLVCSFFENILSHVRVIEYCHYWLEVAIMLRAAVEVFKPHKGCINWMIL